MHTIAIAAIVATALTSCLLPGPGEEKCKEACLHSAKLWLEDKWTAEQKAMGTERGTHPSGSAARPSSVDPAEMERRKAAKWKELSSGPDSGLKECIARCNRPGRTGNVECVLKAETFVAVKECH